MKLTLMLWTAAAAAAVTVQLLAAAPLEMEEKELLEDALATREVDVERREWSLEDQQQMFILDAMGEAFQTLLRLAKRLQSRKGKGKRRGKGRRRGRGRKFKEKYDRYDFGYDDMPTGKRNLKEKVEERFYDDAPMGKGILKEKEEVQFYDEMPGKRLLGGQGQGQGGDDAKERVAEQDAKALCRHFLNSQKVGEAAGEAQRENKEQVAGKQAEIQEEGKQDDSQMEVDLKDLVQTQKMLELCLELIP